MSVDILGDEFARSVVDACVAARQAALTNGKAVVFVDELGRYVEERPDGQLFEIAFDATQRGESHRVVLRPVSRPEPALAK